MLSDLKVRKLKPGTTPTSDGLRRALPAPHPPRVALVAHAARRRGRRVATGGQSRPRRTAMSDDDDSVWAPVLSAHSTRTDLEHAIRKWTEWSLTETRAMLADEPGSPTPCAWRS